MIPEAFHSGLRGARASVPCAPLPRAPRQGATTGKVPDEPFDPPPANRRYT
jgi:hypothetical protein